MPIDPGTAMIAATAIQAALSQLGSNGEHGSTYTKTQRQGINDIFDTIKGLKNSSSDIQSQPGYQQGYDWLLSMFNDPEFFNKFEAPLQRQFEEQIVPDLANRFASMGSGGSLGSTGFRNQLAREGSNLSTNIAALRGGMQQQAIPELLKYSQQPFSNLLQLYQQGLGQAPNNTYQPPSGGPFANTVASFTGAFANGYGQQMGQQMASPNSGGNPLAGASGRVAGQSPLTV